jgi:hypothetical protein
MSTITQVSTSVQVSTLTTSMLATSIQSTTITQTTTVTSLSANPNPDSVVSVSRCWDMLENICANATRGPASFGDCGETLSIFYCGMIQNLKFRRIIPASNDTSHDYPWMLDFVRSLLGNHSPARVGLRSS